MRRDQLRQVDFNQSLTIPRKFLITLLVISDAALIVIALLWFTTDKDVYQMVLIFFSPMLILLTIMTLTEELASAHSAQFRDVEPLSYYDSIQDRAQKFLKLKVPVKSEKLKRSFVHKYIEAYAKAGQIDLTKKERTKLSLVILETGISSQEPGKKNYYERERVAILENILAEKDK